MTAAASHRHAATGSVWKTGIWVLYSRDYRGHPDPPRFRRYPFVGPSARIGVLIDELDRDDPPTSGEFPSADNRRELHLLATQPSR